MAGVDHGTTDVVRAAVLALADLTPRPGSAGESLTVPTDWFTWLPDGLTLLGPLLTESLPARPRPIRAPDAPDVPLFSDREISEIWAEPTTRPPAAQPTVVGPTVAIDREVGRQLLAIQQIRASSPLRIGWLWVAGTTEVPDAGGAVRRRRVLHPLVTRPVRVADGGALSRSPVLVAAGDIDVTARIPAEVRRTIGRLETGRGAITRLDRVDPELLARLTNLREHAVGLAAAAGLPATELVVDHVDPSQLVRRDGLRIVVGVALHCVEETDTASRGNTLRSWSSKWLDARTAFHAVYDHAISNAAAAADRPAPLESTMPLSAVQRAAVERARTAPLSVVTGAPGTGKSHTIAAAVADALRHGDSVLVTAKTEAAVDALIDLLERQPGPTPVVFGSNERRAQLAARLAGGQLHPTADGELDAARRSFQAAVAARDERRAGVSARLEAELARLERSSASTTARAAFPRLFDGGVPPADAMTELDALAAPVSGRLRGLWARRRARRRLRGLATRLGATDPHATESELRTAVDLALALAGEASIDATAAGYHSLAAAEDAVGAALGTLLELASRSSDRLDRPRLAAVAALATALRAGRETRRVHLERMVADDLVRALPLWVGTLGDVDDLLPMTPGLFDLVVVDEASSTEQTLAAPALLRGRRAIVAGDPRQLRHVSFVADGTVESVVAAHGLTGSPAAALLDVRRNSAYDAAAATAPVSRLDEHHRCDPHLVDVVAERLYPGELTVATRSPVTEAHDCVHVERLQGSRDRSGAVRSEVDRVLAELRALHAAGVRSVAVVSPFRAQAAAIEAAVLASLPTERILDLDLRIGTAHGMQGNERDVVICSMGLGEEDGGGARRFAEDPHLLAVLLTRARRRLLLLLSYTPDQGSVLAEYVARSDSPPGRPRPVGVLPTWSADLADDLAHAGVDVARCYPVGRHVVDLAVRRGDTAVAVIAGIHPRGVDAHVDRHLALLRRGWAVVEVPESIARERPGETALEVLALLRPGDAGPLPAAG